MSRQKSEERDALAEFARIFWEEAIRQVEAELEAEEKVAREAAAAEKPATA